MSPLSGPVCVCVCVCVCAFDPITQTAKCFQQYSMPFGGRASAVAFNRCARAIQWLARQIFIILSCYYDDYVNVSPEERAKSSEEAFAMLLDLLGWRYDKDGAKADAMSDRVTSFGVDFDLGGS